MLGFFYFIRETCTVVSNTKYILRLVDQPHAGAENFSKGGGGRGIIVFAGGPFFGKFTM